MAAPSTGKTRVPPTRETLDSLEAQHRDEERLEAERTLIHDPRPLALRRPPGGRLPQSAEWLERLYAGDRVVREKKPAVFDHLRSHGPWFVSVDGEPLSVLDGMSQTATLPAGFSADPVMRAWVEGEFGDAAVQTTDTSVQMTRESRQFASVLQHLVPGLSQVSFTNSGAEANEKALALCRLYHPSDEARKVLAFEGSFHGRTLLALHATSNPKKRGPFEIPGYEATFAPFPVWERPMDPEPPEPHGFLQSVAEGDLGALSHLVAALGPGDGAAEGDPGLLALEVRSLLAVHEALATGEYFACIIEPMQSEGGDRYATARFYRALRLLTRHHDVPLVFDEVQTGFGLSGTFAWHRQFGLVDADGRPDGPDAVTFAKRAQVGVCMSRFTDPEPTASHPASMIRGRIHAGLLDPSVARTVEEHVRARLSALESRFPDLVLRPRARGYALAFDLPTPEHLAAFLSQRFYRGAIVFGAGDRTVRYRLSQAFGEAEIHLLFDAVRRTLTWMEAHPGETPPEWEDPEDAMPPPPEVPTRVREVEHHERQRVFEQVVALEAQVFEAARRDPAPRLRHALDDPNGVSLVAEAYRDGEWVMAGFALAVPMEKAFDVPGPDEDPMLGRENTLYSRTITVDPAYQGLGLGKALKAAQLEAAARRRRPDGTRRFLYVTGRNRVGMTDAMMRVNLQHGAHTVRLVDGQYDSADAQALYYRIPLGPMAPDRPPYQRRPTYDELDLSVGLARPFARVPRDLFEAEAEGRLTGPAVDKLTLCNYVTPATVRALEWLSTLVPALPHLYLTSSRDEMVDKALRILRWHRKGAGTAIGLSGGYVGHTTAAARSLSDPALHLAGQPHFEWPRVPHPATVGVEASITALREAVQAAGGPQAVMGLFVEGVQERTGRVPPAEFWPALDALRTELDLPVILVETTTACYRTGQGPFLLGTLDFVPDLMVWWGGGQTGYVHVSSRYFVPNPLAMISTWDGDELSLLRDHHQLRAARRLELAQSVAAYDAAAAQAAEGGLETHGLGLYRVLHAHHRADEVAEALFSRDIRVRRFPGGHLALVPPLDAAEASAARLERALRGVL